MIEAFKNYIRSQKLFPPQAKVLLAVSGGLDSVTLCELFQKSGFAFAIAHCNFGLRNVESDADELFVKQLATRCKKKFYTVRFDTKAYAKKHKLSIQEAARDLRYAWFEQIRKKNEYHFIATAHHGDDSIETFFINLLRGTGIDGLKGIPAKNGKIIRPILFATRKEIEAFADRENLAWRDDSSNDSDKYLRNEIRHHLVPMLTKLQPSFSKVMQGNMKFFSETSELIQEWISQSLEKAISKKSKTEFKINLSVLDKKWKAFLLYHLLKEKGFNREQANAMTMGSSQRGGGQIFYSGKYEALKDRNQIIVRQRKESRDPSKKITSRTGSVRMNSGSWKISRRNSSSFKIPRNSETTCLDAGKLRFPLEVRRWKDGDRFRPLGMKGEKKVSDFLVDKKISLFGKENIFVILSGSEVACVLGHRIDERFKVTEKTKVVFMMERK